VEVTLRGWNLELKLAILGPMRVPKIQSKKKAVLYGEKGCFEKREGHLRVGNFFCLCATHKTVS